MERWLTDSQLSERLGSCSKMTLWRLRREGKLPLPSKLGNKNVTRESEAVDAIAKLIEPPKDTRAA